MLHLLPIRLLLLAFAGVVGLVVVAAFYAGVIGTSDATDAALKAVRWASPLAVGSIVLTYAAWRWIPIVQMSIYPYLGGTWAGEVRFEDKEGNPDKRDVTLRAKHTLFGIRFLLESAETASKTLGVHAEKDPDFELYRMYYVYLNERKEGVAGARDTYRGLAIVRYILEAPPRLEGDYFTETDRRGSLHLQRVSKTSWWKLWR